MRVTTLLKPLVLLFALTGPAAAQVPSERIENADREPGNWLTYSRTYQGQRYSPLDEITTANVRNLKVRWVYQFPEPTNQTSPLVVDGVMYVTGPNSVTAIDTRTGRSLWNWKRPLPSDYRTVGFYPTNRGAAILDGQIFIATLDCYLVALDLATGAQRWATQVADYHLGYSMTVAPLAVDGKVVTGVSGGEAGIRGLIDAYDAKSGVRAWRFWTIPGPGEPGYNTWSGESAKTGGGPTWVTGSYDPELKLLYWGVGNASPDWNGDVRLGDNLFTCSLLALDIRTGQRKWHFQFTPHDTHDWDSSHVPVLIDARVGGRDRKLIVNANRNGFYYVLDRVTGEFLAGREYAKQTWAKGLDAKGRPIVIPNTEPSYQGTLVWPNINGATIWYSSSYSPQTGLIYVPVRNTGATYFKRDMEYKPGTFYSGGGQTEVPVMDTSGEIRAMEATTGIMKWSFPLLSPAGAGIMSTAGGLVFSGAKEGQFFALDARTGEPLWTFQTGATVGANPISFSADGHQYVAISADQALFVFGL